MEKKFHIKVEDKFDFNFKPSDASKLDLLKLNSTQFHVLKDSKSFKIQLKKSDFYNKEYVVKVNSNSYRVKIANPLDELIKELGFSLGSSKKANDIKAPMPGLILSINVEAGQEVKEGDGLLILEAMKMENSISAPKDGIIKSINVKDGGTVEKGELMIEMA